jgi:hypothetical protein
VPKGKGCEIDVVSNFSGWEHKDQGEFKKCVDEAMVKPKESDAIPGREGDGPSEAAVVTAKKFDLDWADAARRRGTPKACSLGQWRGTHTGLAKALAATGSP